jgi:hypothetical protein
MGKKFARIAAVDASLIKLSLQAFDWATYREKAEAAKMTCVLDWMLGVPNQFVFTAKGRVHDLKAAMALQFCAGWTYLFDRGYFSFDFLTVVLNAGAHFVIRLKDGVSYCVVKRHAIPDVKRKLVRVCEKVSRSIVGSAQSLGEEGGRRAVSSFQVT